MASESSTWWQKVRKLLIVVAIIALVIGVLTLSIVVLVSNGVGINGYIKRTETRETILTPLKTPIATATPSKVTIAEEHQPGKTLWDLLQLLIVPIILAVGGFWLNQIQKSREERATAQRDKTEREITLDKQREDLLQAYLDRMSELRLKEQLRSSEVDAEVRNVARVRTITVLTQLDARRVGYVFAFLRGAGLMSTTSNDNVVSLKNADLRTVNWSQADLSGANLSEANLSGANLSEANLSGANLRGAFLIMAFLSLADLSWANLSWAFFSEANLREAKLSRADLREAKLSRADLRGADLKDATSITPEELEKQAKSLKDATMPDGSIHC